MNSRTTRQEILSHDEREQICGYLGEAKSAAIRALGKAGSHSVRLTKQIEKICAAIEYAQSTARRLRVSP
jgi:hypothetical protein